MRLKSGVEIYEKSNQSSTFSRELSEHVGMSRSSLYNKLLEVKGETQVEYIRLVKLDKAAVLLEKSDMNVALISYRVGFSAPIILPNF